MNNTVKPYTEEGSKKQQVSQMFDNIAPKYDFLNRLLSARMDTVWRKRMINLLQKDQPKVLLDVATGTADVALEMTKHLDVERIVGLDISQEMLEYGRKKIVKKGLENTIELVHGDSENLPFEDNSFDAITVAFGVRNFENLEKGLAEMRRVLRPGGKLVVLEFSRPRIFPFKQIYNGYFKYILPNIGRLTSKDPKAYQYLYESVQAFPDGKKFVNVLAKVGYSANTMQPQTLGICTIYSGTK